MPSSTQVRIAAPSAPRAKTPSPRPSTKLPPLVGMLLVMTTLRADRAAVGMGSLLMAGGGSGFSFSSSSLPQHGTAAPPPTFPEGPFFEERIPSHPEEPQAGAGGSGNWFSSEDPWLASHNGGASPSAAGSHSGTESVDGSVAGASQRSAGGRRLRRKRRSASAPPHRKGPAAAVSEAAQLADEGLLLAEPSEASDSSSQPRHTPVSLESPSSRLPTPPPAASAGVVLSGMLPAATKETVVVMAVSKEATMVALKAALAFLPMRELEAMSCVNRTLHRDVRTRFLRQPMRSDGTTAAAPAAPAPHARFLIVPKSLGDDVTRHDGATARSCMQWACSDCEAAGRGKVINIGAQNACAVCHASFDTSAVRLFVGQLRKQHTAEYVRWLFGSVAPHISILHVEAHTTKGEQRSRGAAFVHLESQQDGQDLCDLLNKRVFGDVQPVLAAGKDGAALPVAPVSKRAAASVATEEGVWLVDADDAQALVGFAQKQAVARNRPIVLPRQPLVVEQRGKPSLDAQPFRPASPQRMIRAKNGLIKKFFVPVARPDDVSHDAQVAADGTPGEAMGQLPANDATAVAEMTPQRYAHDPYAWNPFALYQQQQQEFAMQYRAWMGTAPAARYW